jgi:hypothetical protein
MRTTLDRPEPLVDEARAALGFRSKTDTVLYALRKVVRRSRVDDLERLIGRVAFEFDRHRGAGKSGAAGDVVDAWVWIAAQRKPARRDAARLFGLLESEDVLYG